jgi:glycosyltransferase involved in cell wall biosynthesis
METVKEPKVLVVICCYNHGKYLKQSIQSIQTQSWKKLEIAVVNDGSDPEQGIDEIVESLSREDDRIKYYKFEENHGKWHALNHAMSRSDADFFTSHDSDDVSLPDRIFRQLRCLIETNTIHNLCGFYHCYNEEDVDYAISQPSLDDELTVMDSDTVTKLVVGGFHTPGVNHYSTGRFETAGVSAMFHRAVFNYGVRFNPPKIGLRTLNSEDSDFNFRTTALLNKTSVLAERLYCYRRHTSTNNEER